MIQALIFAAFLLCTVVSIGLYAITKDAMQNPATSWWAYWGIAALVLFGAQMWMLR